MSLAGTPTRLFGVLRELELWAELRAERRGESESDKEEGRGLPVQACRRFQPAGKIIWASPVPLISKYEISMPSPLPI